MAPRKKKMPVAALKARRRNLELKAEAVNGAEDSTSGSGSTEDSPEEPPIVHHKKFGEIRVQQPPEVDSVRTPVIVNGCTALLSELPERNPVYHAENDIPLDGSVIIKPGIFSSETICSNVIAPSFFDPVTDNSAAFMSCLKGIEMLGAGLVASTETKPEIDLPPDLVPVDLDVVDASLEPPEEPPPVMPALSLEESPPVTPALPLEESPPVMPALLLEEPEPKSEVKEEPLSPLEDEVTMMSEDGDNLPEKVEEKDTVEEEVVAAVQYSNIRRSTRIRHIGMLKQREKVTGSPDPDKPVKVKSRWRRSSELEMHAVQPAVLPPLPDLPEPVPESQDELQARLVREKRDAAEGLKSFVSISDNEYHTERNACREAKRMTCDCVLSKEELDKGDMGCGDDCLNRMLFLECGQRCALGERCSNKCFQRKKYADCKIFKTEKKGYGLKAEKALPGCSFIMEYVGEVVDQKEFTRRVKSYAKDEVKHFYFMALKGDTIIDATNRGNISRFINHSCDPNAETQKWTVNGELRIGFFSKRPIQAGEEITFDYRFQRYGKEAQKCYCEAANCRGWIGENADDDESEDESEEESDEESEEEVEDEDEDVAEEGSETTEEAKVDSDMEIESPEAKPKKERKPRVKRVRKPKTPAEKKEGRGRGRRKKEVPEPIVEDLGLEEEVQRLTITGLKNRAHTLMLSRLMVRAEDWATRSRLLQLISAGEEPCRRLFLDYHGLRFLHAWMQSTVSDPTDRHLRRLEILKTLQTLPIPNKTMLMDSKVLAVVEDWSGRKKPSSILSPNGDSGESEESKPGSQIVEGETQPPEPKTSPDSPLDSPKPEAETDLKNDTTPEIQTMTTLLLELWSTLKEVFKIPKKERMEQMKEHEREADREYRQSVVTKENLDKLYCRYKIGERDRDRDRDRDKDRERWDCKKPRDSPSASDPDWLKNHRDRRMSKTERRQLFALQVLREDEAARHRMQQEELWSQHKARCEALSLDPTQHPAMDPISGCPIFFDQNTRTWSPTQPYPAYQYHPHHRSVPGYSMVPNGLAPNALPYPMVTYVNAPYPTPSPSIHMTPVYSTTASRYPSAQNIITLTPDPPLPDTVPPTPTATPELAAPKRAPDAPVLTQVPLNTPLKLPPKWRLARDSRGYSYYYHIKERKSQWEPPSWTEEEARVEAERALAAEEESSSESSESETEDEEEEVELDEEETGTIETEAEELEDVTMTIEGEEEEDDDDAAEDGVSVVTKTCSMEDEIQTCSEGDVAQTCLVGDVADTTQPEDDEAGEEEPDVSMQGAEAEAAPCYSPVEQPSQSDAMEAEESEGDDGGPEGEVKPPVIATVILNTRPTTRILPSAKASKPAKRRPGLVQERIISPRYESSRSDSKKYKEIKQKLRRRKEEKRAEKLKLKGDKKARSSSSSAKKKRREKRVTSAAAESSTDKKIKENFKLSIAGAIVSHLNPYRKPDCSTGRITNNDDFKHLARKLTHFVMLKELKHCQSVDDLQCNDSVKVKARDFVKKYMAKFGPEYERPVE